MSAVSGAIGLAGSGLRTVSHSGEAASLVSAGKSASSAIRPSAVRSVSSEAIANTAEGPMRIRILANEGDPDGTRMLGAFSKYDGVDAAIWDLRHLKSESGVLRYKGDVVPNPDLLIPYHGAMVPDGGMRTMWNMKRSGIPFLNSPEAISWSRDKSITAHVLQKNGIPHPETTLVRTPEEVEPAVERMSRGGSPTFFKDPIGTQGIGVARVTSPKEAVSVGELVVAQPGRRLLVQRAIPTPDGRIGDTRAFVVDGKVVAAMDRKQPAGSDEVRANLHKKATGTPVTLDPADEKTAVDAAQALGLKDFAGVDLMGSPGHMPVIEANSGPGQKISAITGVDVADHIAQLALRRAREAQATRTVTPHVPRGVS